MASRCSFCGKSSDQVAHIVAGPRGVGICSECIELAHEVAGPASRPASGEVVLTGIGQLVTNDPRHGGAIGVITKGAVAARGGKITWVGPEDHLPTRYRDLPEVDCEGRAVVPGFVDPHTHLVFAGDRAGEFGRRLSGESYLEIVASGGGILSTVEATRKAGGPALLAESLQRAERMLQYGTTTVEAKSGYGLDPDTEALQLSVAAEVGERLPIDVIPTFLGAHAVPSGTSREEYLRLVEEEMLPRCAPLATYCDAFCDVSAFTVDESRRVLNAGRRYGLRPRLHANQLADSGGVELAVELRAVSADHLDHLTAVQAAALAGTGTVAVLTPTASLAMRSPQAPGPLLFDAGATVALATDCNPGTSYVESMQLVVAVACLEMGLRPEQAVWAATRGGALALELRDRGWVGGGAVADLVVLDADSHHHIPYRPGTNLAWKVVKGGDVVVS